MPARQLPDLWTILRRLGLRYFDVEKSRGAVMSEVQLLSLELSGNGIDALHDFKTRFTFIKSQMEPEDMPSKNTMSRWLYEKLKDVPCMRAYASRWREASSFTSKFKTFDFNWNKMSKKIRDRTLDQNAKHMKESLKAGGKKTKVPKDDAKPGNVNTKAGKGTGRSRGKRGKGKRKKQADAEEEADPAAMPGQKGQGKGKGGKGKKGKKKSKKGLTTNAEKNMSD